MLFAIITNMYGICAQRIPRLDVSISSTKTKIRSAGMYTTFVTFIFGMTVNLSCITLNVIHAIED